MKAFTDVQDITKGRIRLMNDKNQIKVWDLFVRFFHWSLVLLFLVAYATGDDDSSLHRYVGYAVLGLVAVRIVWGVVGSKYARFSEFLCSPGKALNYVKDLVAGKPAYYTGHNPAAAWMILFFLIGIPVVCLSGYAAYAVKDLKPVQGFGTGLLSIGNAYADEEEKEDHEYPKKNRHAERDGEHEAADEEGDSIWSDMHEISAQGMWFFIFLHILGVTVSSKIHDENLVRGMVTGKKALKSCA